MLLAKIEDHTVNPKMERKEVAALLGPERQRKRNNKPTPGESYAAMVQENEVEPTSPGIVASLKRPASKPMTPDQFMDRALPILRDVYCSALTEMAKSDPAGARDCAAKMHAAIDEAIEEAHDDHAMVLQ